MDYLAQNGEMGLQTVPDGLHPGSDVANLSVFGYDPVFIIRDVRLLKP